MRATMLTGMPADASSHWYSGGVSSAPAVTAPNANASAKRVP